MQGPENEVLLDARFGSSMVNTGRETQFSIEINT